MNNRLMVTARRAYEMAAGLSGGANASADALIAWTTGEAYEVLEVSRDEDGVVITADVKWPDGSTGTFTTTDKNDTWLCIDGYTITHTDSGKMVTQAAVSRNEEGAITTKPELEVT